MQPYRNSFFRTIRNISCEYAPPPRRWSDNDRTIAINIRRTTPELLPRRAVLRRILMPMVRSLSIQRRGGGVYSQGMFRFVRRNEL